MQIPSQRHSAPQTQAAQAPRTVQATPARAQRATQAPAPTDAPPPSAAPGGAAPDQMASNLARLDNFMESAMARLKNAVGDAPEGEVTSFREAAEALESGLSRLREGLQNGTLAPSDIQRGVQNSFQGAREILDGARTTEDAGMEGKAVMTKADDAGGLAAAPQAQGSNELGETVRNRYQGFTDSVMQRVAGLENMDESTSKAVAEAADAFESATARLDQALFNPETGDPIDRGTFQTLYNDALSALQSQLTDLIGGSEERQGAMGGVLYTAQKGVEGMSSGGFGLDVAG